MARILEKRRLPQQGCVPADLQTGKRNFICRICQSRDSGAGCIEAFPSVYIEGERICSDKEWMAEDYDRPPVPVGYSRYFTEKEQNPSVWEYSEKTYCPVHVEDTGAGVLYEFETELTAALELAWNGAREEQGDRDQYIAGNPGRKLLIQNAVITAGSRIRRPGDAPDVRYVSPIFRGFARRKSL